MQHPCVGGNLVLNEDRLAGNQRRAVNLVHRLADDLELRTERGRDLALIRAGVTQLDRQLDGKIVMLVAGVSDEDTGQNVFDFLPGGVRVLFQQPCEDQRSRRRVVRAGDDTRRDHGLLHIVELSAVQKSFRRAKLGALRLIQEDKVGVSQLSVKDDGVGTGKALRVVAVADGEITAAVKNVSQTLGRLADQRAKLAVDSAFIFHRAYLPCSKTILARYFL